MKNHTNEIGKSNSLRRAMLLIASIFTAIAVAVACAICFDFTPAVSVDDVLGGEVSESTTYTNKTGNLTAAGAIQNGDVLDYTTVGQVSVTLPKGTYKLFVWGAQGTSNGSRAGGAGGHANGTYTVTAASQTLYIYVGGQNGTNCGGSSAYPGGGATHISTGSGMINNSTARSGMKIAAGGGGGAGQNTGGNGGAGGGGNGANGSASSWAQPGKGATTSSAGAGGSPYSGCSAGSAGSTGQGGAGGSPTRGGGGGGGWYGGGGGGGDISGSGSSCGGAGGGGGSGYTGGVTGASTSGSRTGNGMARIQVVQVNQAPTSKNATVSNTSSSNYYRGTNRGIGIAASTLASDPDYSNTSGANANSVYFTNGTSTNYDTLPAANNGLFINSGCTTLATNYLSWTWASQTLTITEIKKYPRNGVDGCTQDGRLTLYTRVRDNFGSNTTRGVSVATFYLVVNDRPITPVADTFKRVSGTSGGAAYEYRIGNSTSNNANDNYNDAGSTKIYNPNGANIKTVFLPKPISPNDKDGFTITAAQLYSDADTAYDKVGFKTVANTSYSNYYTISYNADSTYASGLVPSITIKPSTLRPNGAVYVCATITAQTSETATKVAIGAQNTTWQLVFRLANTRPYYASTNNTTMNNAKLSEAYVELQSGGPAKTLNISSMIKDLDDGNSLNAYFAGVVQVPVREYIQVDASNIAVPLNSTSNYYNKTSVNTTAGQLSKDTGMGTTNTGFSSSVIAAAGSAGAASAAITYSFDSNKVIRFTPRAATQYMYSSGGRTGDFYIIVRVVDPSDPTDGGIWFPIALRVTSAAPTETPTVANFTLGFTNTFVPGVQATPDDAGSDAKQNTPESIYLTPISYLNSAGVVCGIGTINQNFNADSGHAQPFTVDPDTFMYANNSYNERSRALNDLVMIDGTDISAMVKLYDTSAFFTVERVSLYANRNVFSQLKMNTTQLNSIGVRTYKNDDGSENTTGYTFYGLKITPKRATNGEYFQFDVNVKDTHSTKNKVRVCIKVDNRALQARRGEGAFRVNTTSAGQYVNNNSINAVAVNYTIERNDVIQITPYDFAYDFDIDVNNDTMNPTVGGQVNYNTNPSNDGFATVAQFVNKKYSVPHTASVSSPATAASQVSMQTLSFANIDNFNANAAQYAGYISASVENKCSTDAGEYSIPCIRIIGLSRTTSAVVQLRFTVTDGYSSIECVVTVTVNNAAPVLNTEENHPKTEGDEKRIKAPYVLSTEIGMYGDFVEFTARELAYDKDGDIPVFVANSAKIVAKDGDNYYTHLDESFKGVASGSGVYNLADYVNVIFTKNGLGEDVVRVTALSSTELFPTQIYLFVTVQDGFRAQPKTADLLVLIDVKNAKPTFNPDGLIKISEEEDRYAWQISYENKSETRIPRYIFNSSELYEANPVGAAPANKICLFDDTDAMQRPMLNPNTWYSDGNNAVEKLVYKTSGTTVDENAFTSGDGLNAAVIYTATYPDDSNPAYQYLNIEVLFFERTVDEKGDYKFIELGNADEKIKTTQYWALKISDTGRSKAGDVSTNIAIALKDDHHGKTVYNSDKTVQSNGSSDITVLNLFYQYKAPGITAMHTYYRTDGSIEASTTISEEGEDPVYAVDYRGFDSADKSYQFVGDVPTDQTSLQGATFSDRFRYQYFEKTLVRKDENGDMDIEVTYKCYPNSGNAFYYEPIVVTSSQGSKNGIEVPMSYIAMPKGVDDSGTDSQSLLHVTFANAIAGSTLQDGAKLLDQNYADWGKNATTLGYVFENLTLTDVDGNSWTGSDLNENPYITIGYVAYGSGYVNSDKYLNKYRYSLEATGDAGRINRKSITSISGGTSKFREDKYGFTFAKKEGGKRARNMLTLTLALRTTAVIKGELRGSSVEYVSVEIDLANASPSIQYINETTQTTVNVNGYIDNINMFMTTSDIEGKTLTLNDYRDTATGDYKLVYTDPDDTDTMQFLMSSATVTTDEEGNIIGSMTEAERKHISEVTNTHKAAEGFNNYYGVDEKNNVTVGDKTMTLDAFKAQFIANPGYNEFFDVTPTDGRTTTIQFIPKAKTQLNIPKDTSLDKRKEILASYHLEEDGNGIYYPFKVIFYDEVDGSAFTDGSWASAVVKVYIQNDVMRVNSDVIKAADKYPGSPNHNAPNYKFKLSKGADFFVDVSSLLIDNDVKLDGSSFAVSDKNFSADEKLFNDYLVMPDSYTRIAPTGNGELPITVGKVDEDSGMPATTIKFSALSAFKGTIDLLYTFTDSVYEVTGSGSNTGVSVVFSVSYNNEAPTANVTTFAGSESINITMRTGDSFTLYAADYNMFSADVKGGFNSWSGGNNKDYVNGYTTGKAEDLLSAFQFDATDPEFTGTNLGSLIVGSDDAASTLRISDYSKFSNLNDADMFTITAGKLYTAEYSSAGGLGLPMSVTLKAKGVVDTTYVLTLIDGERATTTVNINISVVSTAPEAKQNQLPKGLKVVVDENNKVVVNTYEMELKYGESKEFDLGGNYGLMSDIDIDDVHSLSVYKNVDNTVFSINNPAGVSAIDVATRNDLSVNSVVITAIDFIPQAGLYSTVDFRVVDRHGAISDFIHIRVKIAPQEMSVIATQQKEHAIEIESYADYLEKGEVVTVDLVGKDSSGSCMFVDPDVDAPSARYIVNVYALIAANDDGTYSPIRKDNPKYDPEKCLVVSVTKDGSVNPSYTNVADYVNRFFDISLSSDGKTLEFIPNSATIASGNSPDLAQIGLYVEISKQYANGESDAMPMRAGYTNVSVANSALVAVKNSSFNTGYPMISVGEDDKRLRDEPFLTFTGTAGDSLTWNLFDNKNNEMGLFYDYDLKNNPRQMVEGVNVGGLESITYVKFATRGINETIKGKGDVLAVTPSGDGTSITIKINRKVFTGQPAPAGNTVSYTDVSVDIYCADTIGYRKGINNDNNLVKTTITVRVENDVPELKEVMETALINKLGYSLTHSITDGYVLNARIERGSKLDVKISDIIEDSDIEMDSYVLLYTGTETSLVMSDGNLMGSTSIDGTTDGIGRIKANGETLFNVSTSTTSNSYSVSTLERITFTCLSARRGAVGTCQVRFRDSVQSAVTEILTINLIVDNIAPTIKENINTEITLMGLGENATNDDVAKAVKSYSILDFITDANGDDYDASKAEEGRTPTYVYIDSIFVYDTSPDSGDDKPILYGPNFKAFSADKGEWYETTSTLCYVDWTPSDANHQTFSITQFAGVYGYQKISITVVDSGYEAGSEAGVSDGKMYELTLSIIVANPLDKYVDVLDGLDIAYGVTREIPIKSLLNKKDEHNPDADDSRGYTISSIVENDTHALNIFAPGEAVSYTSAYGDADINEWRIRGISEGVTVMTTVTFKSGDITVSRKLPVTITQNNQPTVRTDVNGPKTNYEYNVNMLTNPVARTLKVYPEDWFDDEDLGDVMTFVSPIGSSQSVIVEATIDYDTAAEGGRPFILLKFNRRGESDITLNLMDASGKLYEYTITVACNDAPELSWWENFISLIEANWMWFWIIVAAILLLIILLIIIIVVVHKKRKMRREIEALLNAEIELEEEMMRLGGGTSMPYQSFGYLPPTNPAMNDPGLMLGGSANNPTPNSLQLNAGSGSTTPTQGNIPPANNAPTGGDGFNPDEF